MTKDEMQAEITRLKYEVDAIPAIKAERDALMPLKSGGSKPKKTKGSMVFSFCPFCGVDARVKPAGETQ